MAWLRRGSVAVLIVAFLIRALWDTCWTPSHSGEAHSLAEIVELPNGLVATLRGFDMTAPVLLIVHGGPGASDIPFLHETDSLLEKHFLVVHYDQRGAGKSCALNFTEGLHDGLTVKQHVEDGLDVVQYLLKRFNQERLFLLGGSWGSMVGLLMTSARPELFHMLIVRGLLTDGTQNELLSRSFVIDKRPELHDDLVSPPYHHNVEQLMIQRYHLFAAGGMTYRCRKETCSRAQMTWSIASHVLFSPEMSLNDLVRFRPCFVESLRQLWPELENFNAFKQIPKLEVPFLVLQGRHDHCTDSGLAEQYFNQVEAPRKYLVWFEESAHSPQREESLKFQRELILYALANE